MRAKRSDANRSRGFDRRVSLCYGPSPTDMTPAAEFPAHFARPAAARMASVAGLATRQARFVSAVESVGHLVPPSPWSGRVHGVFARACNVACGELLMTIGTRAVGDGPTTVLLASNPGDLRDRFAEGERIDARQGRIRSARIELELANARVWRPAERGPLVSDMLLEARLHDVSVQLDARRAAQPNVLDREARDVAKALAAACATLDIAAARAHVDRLIGWGEGLTPAGDDFIVGLLAGLDTLVRCDAARAAFRDALATHSAASTQRTTTIAAHALRLAAAGAWSARIDRLLAAICCSSERGRDIEAALHELLALGATSGADTACGIVAALHAWSRPPSLAGAA
jgi:hypothetical protein